MSETELYAVYKNGDVKYYEGVNNSWLGGMHVWNTLNEKYGFNEGLFTGFEKTFGSFNKGRYENYEDIVLGSTFDHVLVKKENFNQLIDNFKLYIENTNGGNFSKQIEVIKQMKNDGDIIAVGWCQTSVTGDLWDEYDEETGENSPYNINEGDKHWYLFDEIE